MKELTTTIRSRLEDNTCEEADTHARIGVLSVMSQRNDFIQADHSGGPAYVDV